MRARFVHGLRLADADRGVMGMGAPIDDTVTLSVIADAIIRDPMNTPTGVMREILYMDKSARTRVLRKWKRRRVKLMREADAKRRLFEAQYERWRADEYERRRAAEYAASTPPEPPRRPLWKRLLGIAP